MGRAGARTETRDESQCSNLAWILPDPCFDLMGATAVGGRFGSFESEMEVESRHPVHRDEPPPSFQNKQLLLGLIIVALIIGASVIGLLVR